MVIIVYYCFSYYFHCLFLSIIVYYCFVIVLLLLDIVFLITRSGGFVIRRKLKVGL